MKNLCVGLLLVIVLAGSLFAQTSARAKATQALKHLTVDDVVQMTGAGLSDDVIIARLRKENTGFDLSTDDMIRLKKAKVGDSVLKVMIDPKAEVNVSTAQSPQSAVVPTQVGAVPTGVRASGATPTAVVSAAGDPNDPLVAHDSGIYLYTKDHEGKPQMIVLERASYQGAKTGGMLGSAFTYGIKKAKTRAIIPGAHASIRVKDPSSVFYFYFEDKQAGLGKTHFGTNSVSNPGQFSLLKLEVKKSDRETVTGQFSALGASSGIDAGAMLSFKTDRIRTGLYKVTVDRLLSGEYCFYASSGPTMTGMAAAYGAGMVGSADVFDFGADVD